MLVPPSLEEDRTAENPVRFSEAFVEGLALAALGFPKAGAKERGRAGYAPGDLLRLYL